MSKTKTRAPRNRAKTTKNSSSTKKHSFSVSENGRFLIALSFFAILNIALWQFPAGRLALYPFTILSTWFHEMGHGLMAIILGGSFHELEIFSNGSGLARHSGDLFLGDIGSALVAAAGPLGPAVAGAVMIGSVKSINRTRAALWTLSVIMGGSLLYFVRGWFGILTLTLFTLLILYINISASDRAKKYLLLFLGVQSALSTYISIDYLLSPGAHIGGEVYPSDTMQISNHLALPYGFWGVTIIFISVWLIISAILHLTRKGK